VPAEEVEALRREASAAGVALTEIGTVGAGEGARLLDATGKALTLAHPSFSHF
jgi:thiamine-monophosphate kinase